MPPRPSRAPTERRPTASSTGIRFDHVSFRYPGTERLVLDDVSLDLPAGTVVAVVGENGAGKTTLVKLLARMYAPDSGQIEVDGVDLAALSMAKWRARLGGAFQDFFRFELRALDSVGVGDLLAHVGASRRVRGGRPGRARSTSSTGWLTGWTRSSAPPGTRASRCPSASGRSSRWPAASCATTRCCSCSTSRRLRSTPRPSTRCSSGSPQVSRQQATNGRVTVLVSHRFSTVRMADVIVVLDGARVVEVGSHDELMAQRGQYAELYSIQAEGFR